MAKDQEFGKGDHVSWNSHGQSVHGKVKKKITKRTEAAGRTVAASEEKPQYEVESEKTERRAVHKPQSLRKRGDGA
ncbi:hypervirulence associated TUDOR domain-containing protein [Streptomyces youssoufiensis]